MPKKFDWLIVGLGNPGKRYAGTRHNIGWLVVESLANKYKAKLKAKSNIYLQAEIKISLKPTKSNSDFKSESGSNNKQSSVNILAIMPTTFMNNSGEAIRRASEKYEIPSENIVVICDEYNFPLGRVHLKLCGSDGGHNGVQSIIRELDTDGFYRLRCGIGREFGEGGMVDYVLSDFKPNEIEARDLMLKKAVASLEFLFEAGPARAMSVINFGSLMENS